MTRWKVVNVLLAMIFAISMTLCITGGYAAEEITDASGQWKYVLEDGGATITRYVTEMSGDLSIPSELDGYPVTGIGQRMLDYLRLTSVTIPDTVVEVLPYTFSYCQELELIEVVPGNPVFESVDGVLFDKLQEMLVAYPMRRAGETYVVPEGTQSIGGNAFHLRERLTSITLPNSVMDIGNHAFSGCLSLTSIVIPGSVANIGDSAFDACLSLNEAVLMEGVTEIGMWAFLHCRELTDVTIPSSLTSIGHGAFCGCSSLTKLSIPANVACIGDDAFADCDDITLIVTEGSYAEQHAKENGIPYLFEIE